MICNKPLPLRLFERIAKSLRGLIKSSSVSMDRPTTKPYTARYRQKIGQLLSPNYFPISW